jgi:hypothetical protein
LCKHLAYQLRQQLACGDEKANVTSIHLRHAAQAAEHTAERKNYYPRQLQALQNAQIFSNPVTA